MNWNWKTTRLLAGAFLLLVGAGTLHRWVHLCRAHADSVQRPLSESLTSLPGRVGSYVHQRDLPLGTNVLQAAGVDSYVYREYVDPGAGRSVQVYVGYWGRTNVGMGHGPDVCFPAVGWHADGAPSLHTVSFSDARHPETGADIALHHFMRTESLGIDRLAVGFSAVVDGEFRASSSGTFLHRPRDVYAAGFLAHVIVAMPLRESDSAAADAELVDFMHQLLPHVSRCIFGDSQGIDARRADRLAVTGLQGDGHDEIE